MVHYQHSLTTQRCETGRKKKEEEKNTDLCWKIAPTVHDGAQLNRIQREIRIKPEVNCTPVELHYI